MKGNNVLFSDLNLKLRSILGAQFPDCANGGAAEEDDPYSILSPSDLLGYYAQSPSLTKAIWKCILDASANVIRLCPDTVLFLCLLLRSAETRLLREGGERTILCDCRGSIIASVGACVSFDLYLAELYRNQRARGSE